MQRGSHLSTLALGTCMLLLAGAATLPYSPLADAQTPGEPVIYLDQGWSQADREMYYQTSQGSAAVSYDIFLNLEAAGSQELFRSDANSERYGLTIQPANPRTNPDALPVGVSKTVITQAPWKGTYAGLTCAACHNAQLYYKGKRIRIDGGVSAFDMMAYSRALDDAMQATLADTAKFDRLAKRLGAASSAAKGELRKRAERDAAVVHQYRTRTNCSRRSHGAPTGSTPSAPSSAASPRPSRAFPRTGRPRWRRPRFRFYGTARKVRGCNGAPRSRIRSSATWSRRRVCTCS